MEQDVNTGFDFENIDFDFSGFDGDAFNISTEVDTQLSDRYQKPTLYAAPKQGHIKYDNAVKLARELRLEPNGRFNTIVAGSFIFGDFIEAYIVEHNIKVPRMTITTLSMSQDNVDSLANLLHGGYVEQLDLIISHYFYANERQALIPYIYETLDIDDRFQLAVAGTHTKTVTFDTTGGKKIVIHGSANLRSSANLEQFTIEDNAELFDFYTDIQDNILERYKTINKPIRVSKLWDLITTKKFK